MTDPYERGWCAYYDDLEFAFDNPYRHTESDEDKRLYQQWNLGWLDAQKSYVAFKKDMLAHITR